MSYLEHTRAVRPSTLLCLYLLATLILDIPQSRTLFLRHDLDAVASVFTTAIATKATLLVAESWPKRKALVAPYKNYCPEAISGVLSRTFLWWLNPLFSKGIKGLITLHDLFDLDSELSSEKLGNLLQNTWHNKSKYKRRGILGVPELPEIRVRSKIFFPGIHMCKGISLGASTCRPASSCFDWFQLCSAFPDQQADHFLDGARVEGNIQHQPGFDRSCGHHLPWDRGKSVLKDQVCNSSSVLDLHCSLYASTISSHDDAERCSYTLDIQ